MGDVSTLDSVVLVVLGIAVVRGIWIGLIREGFSIAALGGGLLAIRYGTPPVGAFIEDMSGGDLGSTVSLWIAGAAIGIGVVFIIGSAGKLLRRGAHAVGLGWADRLAGGAIGLAEGALAAGVILVVTTWAAGADSQLVENSKSIEVLEGMQEYFAEHRDELPAVASPPEWMLPRDRSGGKAE